MSFYLARLEAARHQHRMMEAAAAHAWPPPPYQHAGLLPLPRPQHHHPPDPPPPPPPPLHAGAGSSRAVDTWRGAGSVATRARDDGASLRAGGVAGSATGATTAREEAGGGGEEVRNKRPLPATTAPERRAVAAAAARRLFPPGCGRDAAPTLASDGDGAGVSGAPHKPAPPRPRPALAGGNVDSVISEAAWSPSAAAASAGGGSCSISALEKASAGGQHCQGERLAKSSEASGRNGVAAATAGALMDAVDSRGFAGQRRGEVSHCKDRLVPSARLIPKPTTVSANRRFPPGCRRLGAPLPAGHGTTNQVVWMPSPEQEVVPSERDDMETVVRQSIGSPDGTAQDEGSQDGTALEAQEPQLSSGVTLNHATACVVEAYARHTSSGERTGNRWHCEERRSSPLPAIDANLTNKPGGSSCNVVAAESLAQGLPKEHDRSECVSERAALNNSCSDDYAAALSGESAVMRKKIMYTPRKSVRPPRLIHKSVVTTQCRLFSMPIERETELGWNLNMNDIEDTGVFTKDRAIQNPPLSANKSPWTNEKEPAFFGPKKRVHKKKLKNKRRFTLKGRPTYACALDNEDSILEDDEIFKALAAQETKFEYVLQTADARSKVKLICTRFESICRAIVQAAEHRSVKVRRIDLAADKLIRKLPGFTKQRPVVGSVPGVEVGDEFLYRVQLALVGLHRPFQGGIDAARHEKTGVRIAISVVASGGYPDELLSCSGELVYTGSGKKENGDQKLENGNLALKNCIEMKTPVRVIHGFKDQNREEGSHSRAKEISTFTYDGLYHVVDCWREGSPGSKVFKYKLQRIPGQPQLSLHMAKGYPW